MVAPLLLAAIALSGGIYVSPTGSDANPGTLSRPVQTLEAAVRLSRANALHSIFVRPGTYPAVHAVDLNARDNGLTIEVTGKGRARLSGAISIPRAALKACNDSAMLSRVIDESARSRIKVVDLRSCGFTQLAPIGAYGWGHAFTPAPNELFIDDKPMTLARWPNVGYSKIGKIVEPGNGEKDRDQPKRNPVFFGVEDRAKRWVQARDIWLYGYWKFDWADESIAVKMIDSEGQITLAGPHTYGLESGKPFMAENLPEELDQPGEYYVDRQSLKLYLIEPTGPYAKVELSNLGEAFIRVKGATKVTIRGLDFATSRHEGIQISESESVRVEGCRFFDLGGLAVRIDGGHDCGVQSSDVWATGEGGVVLSGGDRTTLTPGRNFVDNCDLHDFQRRAKTYRPAVLISGVGNRVSHCAMHDVPHSAIIYGGNDHVIEYNEFWNTIRVTGDGGVVYCGRDWSARGTQIRFNHFHDNIGLRQWEPAIYIDDLGSGIHVEGNLIERCHWGFLIGGGRDNVIERNVLIDCALAFQCDARGLGWAANSLPTMQKNLEAVPYRSEIWSKAYPALPDILSKSPMAPDANVLRENVLIRAGKVEDRMEAPFRKTAVISGNVVSTTLPAGMKPLPIAKMGLHPDPLRRSLPAQ